MGIIELIENECSVKLLNYQKEFLKKYIDAHKKVNKILYSFEESHNGLSIKQSTIDELRFDPSYTIDESGNMKIIEISLIKDN